MIFSRYWRLHICQDQKGKLTWSLLSFRMIDQSSDHEENCTPETITIINCVLNAPLMLISILGNALGLAAMIRTPSIRSTPHMIMLRFSCWSLCSTTFHCRRPYQRSIAKQPRGNSSFFRLWSVSLNNDNIKR